MPTADHEDGQLGDGAASWFPPVADAPDRHQVSWVRRIVLDLLAQPPDVDRDRRGVAVAAAPHPLEQLLATERPAGVAHEVDQQLELPGGERDDLAVATGLVGGDVDLHRPGVEQRRRPAPTGWSGALARRSTALTRATSSRGENGLAT